MASKKQRKTVSVNIWSKQIAGSHYRHFKIQPSKFINDNELLFAEGCVIKYVSSQGEEKRFREGKTLY